MSGFAPVHTCPVCGVSYAYPGHACGIHDVRTVSYRSGYRAGLEAAAKLIEDELVPWTGRTSFVQLADMIRALKEKP